MKKLKVKVVLFDGNVEKQSYTLPVDGVQLTDDDMVQLEPMRGMAMAAADAVRDTYVKLLPLFRDKGGNGEYRFE